MKKEVKPEKIVYASREEVMRILRDNSEKDKGLLEKLAKL